MPVPMTAALNARDPMRDGARFVALNAAGYLVFTLGAIALRQGMAAVANVFLLEPVRDAPTSPRCWASRRTTSSTSGARSAQGRRR